MKHIAALMLCGAALCASPASANNVNYGLTAQVVTVCGVYSASGPTIEVSFADLAALPSSQRRQSSPTSVTYRCNTLTGFTRTVSSQNGGYMTLDGNPTTDNARRIPFLMRQSGAHGFANRQLTAPFITTHRVGRNSTALLRGNDGTIFFQAYGVRGPQDASRRTGSRVYAGNYRDTVTITITAN